MNKLFLIFAFLISLLISGCFERRTIEEYKAKYIDTDAIGNINLMQLWRGSEMKLEINMEKGIKNIWVWNDHKVLNEIKRLDIFIKEKNNNKCMIIRNDSIFPFDCLSLNFLQKETRDSLKSIEKWDRKLINQWKLKSEITP